MILPTVFELKMKSFFSNSFIIYTGNIFFELININVDNNAVTVLLNTIKSVHPLYNQLFSFGVSALSLKSLLRAAVSAASEAIAGEGRYHSGAVEQSQQSH